MNNPVAADQLLHGRVAGQGPETFVPFDGRINHRASMNNLLFGLMMDYLGAIDSDLFSQNLDPTTLALDLRVAGGPSGDVYPRNVGLMFFSDNPTRFFHLAQIEVVNIPDLTGEGMTEHIFRGSLLLLRYLYNPSGVRRGCHRAGSIQSSAYSGRRGADGHGGGAVR